MSKQNLPVQNVDALFNAISQIIEQARNTVYRTEGRYRPAFHIAAQRNEPRICNRANTKESTAA